jgi:transcriptional regulator with XRE-family HTH domain
MIGEKIRVVRQSQGRSLAEVAGKAKISVATLSRIETDKQSIDVELLLVLSRVLGIDAADVLGNGEAEPDPLAQRIASLDAGKRTDLWRDLATERRAQRAQNRPSRNVGPQVEELLAQIDYLREELESVRGKVRKQR